MSGRRKASALNGPISFDPAIWLEQLIIDEELTVRILTAFLKEEISKTGSRKAVLGLSGGIDSALVLYLAVKALGPDNVLGVTMPYRQSSPQSLADALEAVRDTGCRHEVVEITPQIDAHFSRFPDASRLRRANKMARERMTILYDLSARDGSLVLGTSNKTELLLGYGTLYGDMASALNAIGDLYKTQVWQLSRYLGVPDSIVKKPPTADLWEGQTDEAELGFTYGQADAALYLFIEERRTRNEIIAAGIPETFCDLILRKVRSSQFKRRLPVIAKLGSRTIDRDFRYARDWGM
ncbi:MAG: NAD+ synthase [Deltaproteobacteria bacterium]|nr:NAD+ synthase [Deltaproteobacteria bacterium]